MESIACDLCGCGDADQVARQTDLLHHTTNELFSIVRCRQCGLQYTNPRPTRDEIGRYYSAQYAFHSSSAIWRKWAELALDRWANSPFAIVACLFPGISRRLAARTRPNIPDPVLGYFREGGTGPFLDIGCGAGEHAHYWGHASALLACRRFTQVAGVEISETARESLNKAGVKCWPDLESVPAGEMFGLIRMNWSLEHVHAPADYFTFIEAHLRPGGRAIITVPNYDGMIYKLAPDCVELPIHLYHFRAVDLEAYGARHRLHTRQVTTFSYPGMYSAAAEAGLFPSHFTAMQNIRVARAFLRSMAPFDAAGWGNDMLVVLEKPWTAEEA